MATKLLLPIALLTVPWLVAAGTSEVSMRSVVDIDPRYAKQWVVVNDGVMGGVSRSRITFDREAAVFEGEVSLENNGGFASVRVILDPTDLSDRDGIELRIQGGGETFQLRIRTDDSRDGVAYRAHFHAPAEIRTVRVPFSEFRPTWRGRILADAPPLDLSSVRQIGFLIADGHQGPFRLRVERIDAYRASPPTDDTDPAGREGEA